MHYWLINLNLKFKFKIFSVQIRLQLLPILQSHPGLHVWQILHFGFPDICVQISFYYFLTRGPEFWSLAWPIHTCSPKINWAC